MHGTHESVKRISGYTFHNRQGSNGLWFKVFAMLWCLQALLAASAYADGAPGITTAAEPSLSDTDAWLQAHLPTYASTCEICVGSVNGVWTVFALYHASGCTLSININSSLRMSSISIASEPIYRLDLAPQTGRFLTSAYHADDIKERSDGYDEHVSAKVNFSEISPNDLKVTAASTVEADLAPINVAPNGTVIRFTFDDEEMANRVKHAFERAITLCGGKPEPF